MRKTDKQIETDGRTDRQTDGQTDGRTEKYERDVQTYGRTDRWTDGRTDSTCIALGKTRAIFSFVTLVTSSQRIAI
jgi:hypothetical protein